MAGLGEVCTHIASVLFWVEIAVKMRNRRTVTNVAAYWVEPSSKIVPPKMIEDIDFRSTTKKKRELESEVDGTSATQSTQPKKKKATKTIPSPTTEELDIFYQTLNSSPHLKKAGILTILPGYAEQYKPKSLTSPIPLLSNLYDETLKNCDKQIIDEKCDEIFRKIEISEEQAITTELQTRGQNENGKWFQNTG